MERTQAADEGGEGAEGAQAHGQYKWHEATLGDFPAWMRKKVLLLRHFRAYLAEQRRREDAERSKTAPSVAARAAMARSQASAASGGQAAMGESEGAAAPSQGRGQGLCVPPTSEVRDSLGWLLYVKKWMRTKHALLFRLSSHVVQVLFTDRTSVVLASESGAMTYVGKDGAVSAHLLGESLYADRDDIARRLRYTRDLLSQLIQRAGRRHGETEGAADGEGEGEGVQGGAGSQAGGDGSGAMTPGVALGLMRASGGRGSASSSSSGAGGRGLGASGASTGSAVTRASGLPRDSDAGPGHFSGRHFRGSSASGSASAGASAGGTSGSRAGGGFGGPKYPSEGGF